MFSDSPGLVATDLYTSIVYCGTPKYKAYMGNAVFFFSSDLPHTPDSWFGLRLDHDDTINKALYNSCL